MRLIKHICALLFCAALGLQAQTTNQTNVVTRTLSLEESIRLALENNLQLQIARFNPQLARVALDAGYAYYEPVFGVSAIRSAQTQPGRLLPGGTRTATIDTTDDILTANFEGILPVTGLSYDVGADFVHTFGTAEGNPIDNYDGEVGINLRQPLLRNFWIDPARAQIQISKKNLKISELDLMLQIMQLVRDVQVAYFELIAAQDNVKAAQSALELAQRLVAENRRKVQVGTLAPLDEKQAESEAAIALANLITATRQAAFAENALKRLITDHYEGWYYVNIQPAEKLVAIPETYNLGNSWFNALTLRPDINRLKQEVERAGILVRLNFNQLFPSLDLVGSYGRSGFGGNDAGIGPVLTDIRRGDFPRYTAGVVLSVPLGNRAARSDYRAAKLEQRQLGLVLKDLHETIIADVQNAVQLAQASFQRVDATRQARIFAEAALEAEQKRLEAGKRTYFEVLQLQRDLSNARFAEIRALADYNRALAELYFSEGTILERNRLNVDIR